MIVRGKVIFYDRSTIVKKGEIIFHVLPYGNCSGSNATDIFLHCQFRGRIVDEGIHAGQVAFKIKHNARAFLSGGSQTMTNCRCSSYNDIYYADLDFETGEFVADIPDYACGWYYATVRHQIVPPYGDYPDWDPDYGTYNAGFVVKYEIDDITEAYECIQTHTSSSSCSPENTDYWQVLETGDIAERFWITYTNDSSANPTSPGIPFQFFTYHDQTPVFWRTVYDESGVPTSYIRFGEGDIHTFSNCTIGTYSVWANAIFMDFADYSGGTPVARYYKATGSGESWTFTEIIPTIGHTREGYTFVNVSSVGAAGSIFGTVSRAVSVRWSQDGMSPPVYDYTNEGMNPLTGLINLPTPVFAGSFWVSLAGIVDGDMYVVTGYEDSSISLVKNPNLSNENWLDDEDYEWLSDTPPDSSMTGKLGAYVYSNYQRWNDSTGEYSTASQAVGPKATQGGNITRLYDSEFGALTWRIINSSGDISATIMKGRNGVYFQQGAIPTAASTGSLWYSGSIYHTGYFFRNDHCCYNASTAKKADMRPGYSNKIWITNITTSVTGSGTSRRVHADFTFNMAVPDVGSLPVWAGKMYVLNSLMPMVYYSEDYSSITKTAANVYRISTSQAFTGKYIYFCLLPTTSYFEKLRYIDGLCFSLEDCDKLDIMYGP